MSYERLPAPRVFGGRFGSVWRWITVCALVYVMVVGARYAITSDVPRAIGAGLGVPFGAWMAANSWGVVPRRIAPVICAVAILSATAWLVLPHLGLGIVDPL